MSERRLRFTIYEPRQRLLWRDWWSTWELEVVNEEDGLEWHDTIAKGAVKRYRRATYAQFDLGEETDISRTADASSAGGTTWLRGPGPGPRKPTRRGMGSLAAATLTARSAARRMLALAYGLDPYERSKADA